MGVDVEWDVLVVGAGPAGSTAARFAAAEGARVLVVDRRREVGVPVQCAEHVPLPTLAFLPRPSEVVAQPIEAMRTHLPGGHVDRMDSRGAIVRRDLFDQQLAEAAVDAGAEYLLSTRLVELTDGVARLEGPDGARRVRARVIIGADGPRSRVREWTGGGEVAYVNALQHLMRLTAPLTTTECYFRRYLPGGYGWVFPRGEVANVGIGVAKDAGVLPSAALARFVEEVVAAGVVEPGVLERTAGPLPVGGMITPLRRGNVLLVGDAAGQCHPMTGAGIPNAVQCGELAGRAAGEAAVSGDLDVLDEYVEEASEMVGPSLAHAAARRREQAAAWAGPEEELVRAMRRGWVAFDEYYA